MEQNLHDGHRERMRKEFIENGFGEYTPDHKLLELLLFYCISRKDTNLLAHQLINRFGSLSGVLDASIDDLKKVKGIGDHAALLLTAIMPIARAYLKEKSELKPTFKTLEEIGDYLLKRYTGISLERASIMSLDSKGRLLGFDFLSEGDVSSVGISFRDAVSFLIDHNATVAVLAHNHPNGFAVPSPKDCILTEQLADSLKNIGIYLADHVVIANGDYVSMAQSREFLHIFKRN